jgi:hypothetical protein
MTVSELIAFLTLVPGHYKTAVTYMNDENPIQLELNSSDLSYDNQLKILLIESSIETDVSDEIDRMIESNEVAPGEVIRIANTYCGADIPPKFNIFQRKSLKERMQKLGIKVYTNKAFKQA